MAADTAAKAQAAKDRLARVEKGEAVAGIGPPLTRKDLLRISGMTEAQARHCERVAGITGDAPDDPIIRLVVDEGLRAEKRAVKAAVRKLYRTLPFPLMTRRGLGGTA